MNISDLIAELQAELEVNGDLDVTVWADHGQHNEKACCVGVAYRDEDGETICEEDLEDSEDSDFEKVIEIS